MKRALAALLLLCGCYTTPPVNKARPHWVVTGDDHDHATYYDVTGREWATAVLIDGNWHLHFGCGVKHYIGDSRFYDEPEGINYEALDDAEQAAESVCAEDDRFMQ